MPIYGPDPITFDGVSGDRYWIHEPFSFTGIADRVQPPRRVRFLVGKCDRLVNLADAQACATRFPDGACYIVPGMGHGTSNHGISFTDHVRYFLVTQLGDWRE